MNQDPIQRADEGPDSIEAGDRLPGRDLVLYDSRVAQHRELAMLGHGASGADPLDQWRGRRLGMSEEARAESERLGRWVNRLSGFIRACGAVSIVLGLASAAFLWPRVRLTGLAVFGGLGIGVGLLGLGLRPFHRGWLRQLADEPRGLRRLYRTKAHRCRVGLGVCGILLGAGLLIGSPRPPAPGVSAGVSRVGAATASTSARRRQLEVASGESYRHGDLSLRVASSRLRRRDGSGLNLELLLELRNISKARKLDVDRIHDLELPLSRCYLWDSLGNDYNRLERPVLDLTSGRDALPALYPEESLRVRLVFERPVRRARQLLLLIPPGSFDLPEAVLFQIDAAQLATAEPR